jgi:hypothetical protein
MAEQLKQQYNLVVLKVQLRPTSPEVLFTLQAKVDGQMTDVHVWNCGLSELGLTLSRASGNTGRTPPLGVLPPAFVSLVAAWMDEHIHDGQPLWVHLVKPYGALRFLPWERAFGSGFRHAILMLPDFLFPPPRESSETLDVALCASAPLNAEEGLVRDALRGAIDGILTASVRRTEVHVFVDATLYPEIQALAATQTNGTVRITPYDPAGSAPYVEADPSSRLVDRTGQVRSPWLLWMRDALKRHSVDVVHMVGHGYLARDRGALLLAQSPLARTNDFRAGPVSAIELCNFMNQVGAWGTVFTGVLDNHSPLGMRALADEIGQSRPGPVLMHSLDRDAQQQMLAPAYRLLFDTAPSGMPVSDALFVYCQPYRLGTTQADPFEVGTQTPGGGDVQLVSPVARNQMQSNVAAAASNARSALDPIIQRAGPLKPWVAATERVAEQVQLRMQKNVRDDDDDDPVQDSRMNASISMLESLRASVAGFAEEDAARERAARPSPPAPPAAAAEANTTQRGGADGGTA